ncbi:zinc HIT-type [Pyrrhoderma noxium]|uniref:Zinc HIT-type n=1 Tax=Pyrrhoderma noxium TaxID=2282107 RepID=A0A286UA53_9AGAM|nr:zinc HIT-type [Pyrrhoderma noxium]
MAPGGTERKQPRRKQQSGAKQVGLPPEVIEKRIKRYLDELERTNYTEPTISLVGISYGEGGMSARGRARETISDKRVVEGVTRKKTQSKAVRDALVYRKNLSTLIEESGISRLPPTVPTYLTAVAPPPIEPARLLCSVCGYWGRYKCLRCSMAYCDRKCEETHNETRCERRVF